MLLCIFFVLGGLAFLAGAPLNLYVLFVTRCCVERMASTMWFLNQAVSDFIFILCLPLRYMSVLIREFDCTRRLSSIITSLHMFSSTFLLMAISMDRCVLVAYPEWAQKYHTASLAFWVVLGTWALSSGFSLRYSDIWESLFQPANNCMNVHVHSGMVQATDAIQFLAGFLIPFALSLIPAIWTLLAIRLGRNWLIQTTRPLKILLGFIPTFFLFWMPYHIIYFLQISHTYPQPHLETGSAFACVLTSVNSCLNPIFYITMDEEFLRYRERTWKPQATNTLEPQPAE